MQKQQLKDQAIKLQTILQN